MTEKNYLVIYPKDQDFSKTSYGVAILGTESREVRIYSEGDYFDLINGKEIEDRYLKEIVETQINDAKSKHKEGWLALTLTKDKRHEYLIGILDYNESSEDIKNGKCFVLRNLSNKRKFSVAGPDYEFLRLKCLDKRCNLDDSDDAKYYRGIKRAISHSIYQLEEALV